MQIESFQTAWKRDPTADITHRRGAASISPKSPTSGDLATRLLVDRFAGEVVEGIGQGGEGQDADPVVIQERVGDVEDVAVLRVGGFPGFEGYADETGDASGGDEA